MLDKKQNYAPLSITLNESPLRKTKKNISRDITKLAFGESLLKQRLAANQTLESLAEKSGVTLRYVQDLQAGNKLPSILSLIKLCNALNISTDELLKPVIKAYKRQRRAEK